MSKHKGFSALLLGVLLLIVSGCGHVMSSQIRQAAKQDLLFSAVFQNPNAYLGQTVIWGGVIIETINRQEGTEIKILETPLTSYGLPEDREHSEGRFIVKASHYLDPEIYQKGKKITIGGEVTGQEVQPLGETQYAYPVISAKELHLWREEEMRYWEPYPGYFWFPWYYDPWYYPYWYPYYRH